MVDYECPFKVGDMVIPIEPSEDEKDPNDGPGWNTDMNQYVGRVPPVHRISEEDGCYYIKIGETLSDQWWMWKDDWLKPVVTDYTLF